MPVCPAPSEIDAPTRVFCRTAPTALQMRVGEPELPAPVLVRVFDAVRRMALQHDLATAAQVLRTAVSELTGAERVYCLFRHHGTGELVDYGCADEAPWQGNDGSERVIVQPIQSGELTVAAFAAVRRAQSAPFSPLECHAASVLAKQCGAILQHFTLQDQLRARPADGEPGLFRRQALARYHEGGHDGDVIRLSPAWMRWSYRAVLLMFAVGLTFATCVTVDRHSVGPAVIRVDGTAMTAPGAGTVARVHVRSGDRVQAGQLLVDLESPQERAELDYLELEYRARTAALLFDPSDPTALARLVDLHSQLNGARARLRSRQALAPTAGIVRDVRVRQGMVLRAGDHLLTLADASAEPIIVAFLPGRDRADLEVGMTMRIELAGRDQPLVAELIEIGHELIGPGEARRYLGAELADAVALPSSVVLVRARIGSGHGSTDGPTLFDGMVGRGEAVIGSRRLIAALIPGLDAKD